MKVSCHILVNLILIVISSFFLRANAQLGFDLKIDKPDPYGNRVLKAEKTGSKPLKASKKFFQNLSTHFNYFFNANNKLNDVIETAKLYFRDDYTNLLPFYNYTLDVTAQNSQELDSVIYKCRTGLVMHDLRNDWCDNMYLLWGAAWFLEKKFDSATLMFQFINHSFADKEKDGYYKYIGSNLDGNNALTISTKEKKKNSSASSRNDAFLWQMRTQIEMGRFAEAGSLIATLKEDPFFPKRLNTDLEEIQAYWFYRQNVWDSSATHLILALNNAHTNQEKARWEYLAAQMFELSEKPEQAQKFYVRASAQTTDPVMDVYARLNAVRVNKDNSGNYIEKNIEALLKMAKKDRYSDYRDIIYYMAAQMELELNNPAAAENLLLKSTKYNNGNPASKSKAYLMLADLAYKRKKYLPSAFYYDSVTARDLQEADFEKMQIRKPLLAKVTAYSGIISRQDSLQKIAAMPEEKRKSFINKLVKKMRRQQGLSEVPITSGSTINTNAGNLFPTSQQKGEWYFYNEALRTQGATQFKQVWGNRPNLDNWRRFANVSQQLTKVQTPVQSNDVSNSATEVDNTPSYDNLIKNVPLTELQMQVSNDSLSNALFSLGTVYLNEIEDDSSAMATFDRLRTRFPNYKNNSELLFDLYYANKKTANFIKAEELKKTLLSQYPSSRHASIIATGKDPAAGKDKSPESTKAYEDIYNLFIEGKFEEAEAAKKQADSIYKTNYWNPQLLYIESVYHIRRRDDSVAKNILQTLIAQNINTPMAIKAQNLIDVLNRRAQIEDELSRYQIHTDSTSTQPIVSNPVVQTTIKKDTVANKTMAAVLRKDTVSTKPMVVVIKKDSVAVKPMVVHPAVKKDATISKTVFLNPVKKDSVAKAVVAKTKMKKDSVAAIKKPLRKQGEYYFDSSSKHYVVIVLNKVDPLFVTEVKNAYFRFNREHFGNKTFQLASVDLDADKRLVLISDFINTTEALSYVQSAKHFAPFEVIPWLKADKYSFSIITQENLDLLLQKKDFIQYQKFLDQNLPGKL